MKLFTFIMMTIIKNLESVKFFYCDNLLLRKEECFKMALEKSFYMTQEGKEKLETELHYLKTERRQEVVERIKVARDFGDLSENSEYDSAKEDQAFVETRIAQVEKMIRNAIIIENDKDNPDIVSLGTTVTFIELPDGEDETYTIVGSAEADPFEGKISNDSPMAKSLLGHEKGTEVSVATPGGDIQVRIVNVE
jgi:transcription elongation factor GreA